jgi:predicted hydrocarbon binding protein
MPIELLKGLHEEISELLGNHVAPRVIYNCGFRSGQYIVNDMTIKFKDLDELKDKLPELWLQMGLGIFQVEKITEYEILLSCMESSEAVALGFTGKPSCDLTSGYLAGMISTIFGKKFKCEEKLCISKGDSNCLFELLIKE